MLGDVRPPRIAVLAPATEARAARLAALLGAAVVARGRALLRARPDGVFVVGAADGGERPRGQREPAGSTEALARAAAVCTVAGAAAVVLVWDGTPPPLPWWGRRFHRILCGAQDQARAWRAAGVALGRLVVVEPGDDEAEGRALTALVAEVWAMGGRASRSAPPPGPLAPVGSAPGERRG
jgi:hypothetical protein